MIVKDIKLNDNLITPDGRSESFNYEEIANSNRTASGKLKKQIIAKKIKLDIEYELISEDDLKSIYEQYETGEFISVYLNDFDGQVKTFSADMTPPEFEKDFYGVDGKWYFSSLSFTLEEV